MRAMVPYTIDNANLPLVSNGLLPLSVIAAVLTRNDILLVACAFLFSYVAVLNVTNSKSKLRHIVEALVAGAALVLLPEASGLPLAALISIICGYAILQILRVKNAKRAKA